MGLADRVKAFRLARNLVNRSAALLYRRRSFSVQPRLGLGAVP